MDDALDDNYTGDLFYERARGYIHQRLFVGWWLAHRLLFVSRHWGGCVMMDRYRLPMSTGINRWAANSIYALRAHHRRRPALSVN